MRAGNSRAWRGWCPTKARPAAAYAGLAFERRLHRLEGAAEPPERFVAVRTGFFEGGPEYLFNGLPEITFVSGIDPLVDVGGDHRQHRRHHGAVDPGVEGLRHAVADVAAEEGRRIAVALLQVLGDLPGVAHDGFAVADDRHRPAARKGNRSLVRQADRLSGEIEALVLERHPRAPRKHAVTPLPFALQLPKSNHAAFLTSWLSGLARRRRSVCSARSRAARRKAWSRPARYCGGQNWLMCWYQAEACSVK